MNNKIHDANEAISEEIQKLQPSTLIEMFVLEIPETTDKVYFHAGTNELRTSVVWQKQKYTALPVQVEGFDVNTKGELPRPTLTVFSALIRKYDDLIGAKLIRKRTFAKYLDAENFPNGNPTADPNVHFPDDIWYIDKKAQENRLMIQWELASAFDLMGVQLPRRQIIQNYCQWRYRGGECGYDGPYFDIDDQMCTDQSQDKCAKKLSSCRARFEYINIGSEKPVLPFGGFPGATRNNG